MLLKYIKEKNNISDSYFDSIRVSLDEKLHYYGEHFKNPATKKSSIYNFYDLKIFFYFIFDFFKRRLSNKDKQGKLKLISTAYFNLDLLIAKNGINVYRPSWSIRNGQNIGSDLSLLKLTLSIKRLLNKSDFNYLISLDFKLKSDLFRLKLSKWLIRNKINAVIVANDVSFFDNTLIKVAKELNIPSYVFLHGLPARYNNIDDNRADFLLLWGEKLKDNYIKAGLSPHKLIVCGHPLYNNSKARVKNILRFGFSDILVLSKPLSGANHSDIDILSDRANSILYLLMIQNVLVKFQVKNVRLRLHPSESSSWYKMYLDSSFFIFDNCPIHNSLEKASLLIGPTSTVFLESIYFGVNYTIFEPSFNSLDILNNRIVSPFDGLDSNIPVANSEIELERIIRDKVTVNTDCLLDYFNEGFDLSFLMNLKMNNE
jgi:hypothetical protein